MRAETETSGTFGPDFIPVFGNAITVRYGYENGAPLCALYRQNSTAKNFSPSENN